MKQPWAARAPRSSRATRPDRRRCHRRSSDVPGTRRGPAGHRAQRARRRHGGGRTFAALRPGEWCGAQCSGNRLTFSAPNAENPCQHLLAGIFCFSSQNIDNQSIKIFKRGIIGGLSRWKLRLVIDNGILCARLQSFRHLLRASLFYSYHLCGFPSQAFRRKRRY